MQHCLVSRARQISSIRKLYSHPQAWGQCTRFLQQKLKHAERQDVSSTSKGCELVAQQEEAGEDVAAISSKMAAELYGVPVLFEGIEDRPGKNSTRFFVIRNRNVAPPFEQRLLGMDEGQAGKRHKSLITFTVPHTSPGSLADALSVFKTHGLNLTSINTRPSGEETWHYSFFVEFLGKREENGDGDVNRALRELDGVVRGWRWLGSWEDALGG